MLLNLPIDVRQELVMYLTPRFVYLLMQTNKTMHAHCRHKTYWERVAFHLAFRGVIPRSVVAYHDMALLDVSYRRAMDMYIESIRSVIATDPTLYRVQADATLQQLIAVALRMLNNGTLPIKNMRMLARELVLDTTRELTEMMHLVLKDGLICGTAPRLLPAEDYVSGNHRTRRANARVLRMLDDETGIDLATKRRLLAGIALFGRDLIDTRIDLNGDVARLQEGKCARPDILDIGK